MEEKRFILCRNKSGWHCKGLVWGRTKEHLVCNQNTAHVETWLVWGKAVPCQGLRHSGLGDRELLRLRGGSWEAASMIGRTAGKSVGTFRARLGRRAWP